MTSDKHKSQQPEAKNGKRPDERERRLASALRANLRRRKAQARERSGAAGTTGGEGEREE